MQAESQEVRIACLRIENGINSLNRSERLYDSCFKEKMCLPALSPW